MENELLKYLKELQVIKKYLIKKGKLRFKGNVIKNKLSETEILYSKCKKLIELLANQPELKSKFLTSLSLLKEDIESCYKQILNLCTIVKVDSDSSSESDFCESLSYGDAIMEFDLKTACSLIPVMNSNENNIKNIIDSIEMYSEMLSETGRQLLIKFVLKSRLSENAKLRMSHSYPSTDDLVRDLRNTLIPKKSFTAIQSRLQNATQDWRTIDQFGTELEKLFTNLTVSQADGNSQCYSILKPINEKLAIKRFADGLRDSRLSMIIAARNYDSLKDAVQAAKDEEMTAASTSVSDNVMQFSHRNRGKLQQNYFSQRKFYNYQPRDLRGYHHRHQNVSRSNNVNNFSTNNFGRGYFNNNSRCKSYNQFRGSMRGTHNNSQRSRSFKRSNENRSSSDTHGHGSGHRVFYTDQANLTDSSNSNTNNSNSNKELQFFRS